MKILFKYDYIIEFNKDMFAAPQPPHPLQIYDIYPRNMKPMLLSPFVHLSMLLHTVNMFSIYLINFEILPAPSVQPSVLPGPCRTRQKATKSQTSLAQDLLRTSSTTAALQKPMAPKAIMFFNNNAIF